MVCGCFQTTAHLNFIIQSFSKCFEGIKCAKKKINGDSYHENERFYSVNIYEVQVVPYIS